jgi:hypothetical protein
MPDRLAGRVVGFCFVARLASSTAAAQPAPVASNTAERFGFGVAAGLGSEGTIRAVRISLPASDRFTVELTAGHVNDLRGGDVVADGASFSAQLRWLWHGRDAKGWSGYWFFGPQVLEASSRTPVRWPNGTQTWLVDERAIATMQGGYGRDWLSPHGARTGLELSAGSNYGVPVVFAHLFVVWGPPRR